MKYFFQVKISQNDHSPFIIYFALSYIYQLTFPLEAIIIMCLALAGNILLG